MRFRFFTACLLVSFGFSVAAQAQTYKIQLKEYPDPGKKIEEKFSQKSKESFKVSVMGMVVKDESKERTEEKINTLETLEKGEGSPKKYLKTFTKAISTVDKKETTLPYQGRTIIFELKNGKYEAKPEGQPPLPAETLKKLEDSANKNVNSQMSKTLLPEKAVPVADTWKIDIARLARTFDDSLAIDPAKSTGQGRLLKVYKKGDRQFGVLDFDLKLMVTSLGPTKLTNPIPLKLQMTVDAVIDGTSTEGTMNSRSTLQGKTEIMQGRQTIQIEFDLQTSGRQVQSAEK